MKSLKDTYKKYSKKTKKNYKKYKPKIKKVQKKARKLSMNIDDYFKMQERQLKKPRIKF